MRRKRILIYLILIIVDIAIVAVLWLWFRNRSADTGIQPSETQIARSINIVTAGQNINPGAPITEDMLGTMEIQEDALVAGLYTNKADLNGMYARYPILQGVPITDSMVSFSPGNVNLPGSTWSPFIPQGLTAISIPITRLNSTAYGIRGGDYINIIVSILLVDVDSSYQTILPNYTAMIESAGYLPDQLPILTARITSGGEGSGLGRAELDPTIEQPFYIVPSEVQRPRLVTQMIMQNIQVLHTGTFPLPGEQVSEQLMAPVDETQGTVQPQTEGQGGPVQHPDIITLMVTPQDAVTLTYLIFSGAEITLTLRNPNDQAIAQQPEAATLQYLLSQYNIPVPAKLPYALDPRINVLEHPILPNDFPSAP